MAHINQVSSICASSGCGHVTNFGQLAISMRDEDRCLNTAFVLAIAFLGISSNQSYEEVGANHVEN